MIEAARPMKNWVLVGLLMLWGFYACEPPIADETDRIFSDTIRVGTYNVRIATCTDDDHRSWCFRRNFVALQVYTHAFDVLGIQELTNVDQENDLRRLLPDFGFYSKGDGNSEGTFGQRLAIVYDKSRFACLDSGFFFLSEILAKASVGWDAERNHLCLWLRLRDRQSKQDFYLLNTHFSWCGTEARKNSAQLIADFIQTLPEESPVLLTGDLNAPPTELDTYRRLTQDLSDSRDLSETMPLGYEGTFNNWEPNPWNFTEKRRIDYIFTRGARVLAYRAINEQFVDDCWPSDHFPIMISVLWQH